jgi:hypothetical protein
MQMRVLPASLMVVWLAGCAAVSDGQKPMSTTTGSPVETTTPAAIVAAPTGTVSAPMSEQSFSAGMVVEQFGVRLTGVRLTANGYVVDLRYRVLDPVKAQALLDRTVRPVLVDETTGNRFYVPVPPTVGALRQTSRN